MTIRLKSLDRLEQFIDRASLPPGPPDETDGALTPHAPVMPCEAAGDLASLLAEIEAADTRLDALRRADDEARAAAAASLDQHDLAVAAFQEANAALERARQVRLQAETLVERAFSGASRTDAMRLAEQAAAAEAVAARVADDRRREADALAAQPDVQRLLDERRRDVEAQAEQQRAAELEAARRLSDGLARAKEALEMGQVEEARALAGDLAREHPTNAEIASLLSTIAWREVSVKNAAAEQALRTARRLRRSDPVGAAAALEAVDVDGLSDELARLVFGEWARVNSRRLADEREEREPLRYAPDPGRGLVLARERADGPYVVVSALGMGETWRPGSVVADRAILRRARPLR